MRVAAVATFLSAHVRRDMARPGLPLLVSMNPPGYGWVLHAAIAELRAHIAEKGLMPSVEADHRVSNNAEQH